MSVRTLFNSKIGDVDSSAKDPLGALRCSNDIWYRYVQVKNTTATVAGVAGDPVAYGSGTGHTTPLVVLDLTDADTQPVGAGFLTGSVAGVAGTSYYTWVQLTGVVTVPTAVAGTPVIGSGVMMDTTDKQLTKVTGVISSIGTAIAASGANNKLRANIPF